MGSNKSTTKYVVRRSTAGLGLFARTDIKKGEFVIEYTGEHIDEEEANRRGGMYLFSLDKDGAIDGKGRENLARYINHACKPNCEAEHDEEEKRVRIYALRSIKAGEELTYDYGKEFFNEYIKPKGCRCAACS